MSVWFSTAAVVPSLEREWEISSAGAAWLTTAVQLGFVAGAVALGGLNLSRPGLRAPASSPPARVAAAPANLLVALVAGGLEAAIVLRFATGIALAGVYPAGVKLHGLVVSHRSRGGDGCARGCPHARLRDAAPGQRARRAAVGRGPHRHEPAGLRRRRGRPAPAGRSSSAARAPPAPRLCARDVLGPHPAAREPRLLRPHVGAVRVLDLAARLSAREPGGVGSSHRLARGRGARGLRGDRRGRSRRMHCRRARRATSRIGSCGLPGDGGQRGVLCPQRPVSSVWDPGCCCRSSWCGASR